MKENMMFSQLEIDNKLQIVKITNFDSRLFFGKELQPNVSIVTQAGDENRQQVSILTDAITRARSEQRNSCAVFCSKISSTEKINVCAHIELHRDGSVCLYLTQVYADDVFTPYQDVELGDIQDIYTIFDQLPIGVEIFDKDGRLVYLNNQVVEDDQVQSKEELLGLCYSDNPLVTDEIKQKIVGCDKVRFIMEYDYSKMSGFYYTPKTDMCYYEVLVSTIRNFDGDVLSYLVVYQDVTELSLLTNKYQRLYNHNEVILDALPIGIGVCSMDGVLQYINDSLCRTFSLSKDAINEIPLNLLTGTSAPEVIKNALSNGLPTDFQFKYLYEVAESHKTAEAQDKKLVHIECNGRPIINANGEAESYIFITNDVTERVETQEVLRQSLLKTEMAMKSADIMFWEFDVEKNLFYSDNEILNGYNQSVPIEPEHYLMSVHQESRADMRVLVERMQAGEDMSFSHDLRILLSKEGGWQNCTVNGSPYTLEPESGRVLKYVGARKNNSKLHKKKLLQDKILNSIPVSIHIKDVEDNFRYIFCNDESNRLFGLREDITMSELMVDESVANIKSIDYEVYNTGREHTGLERIELKDGRVCDTITRRSVIEDDGKRLLLSIRWDQSMQNDLKRRSKLLTLTLEMMNAFTWFYHPDKNYITFGGGFEKIGRLESEINTIDTYIESIHPDDIYKFRSSLQRVVENEGLIWDVEYRIDWNKDGQYQWVQSRGVSENTVINNAHSRYLFGMTISIESHKQSELTLLKTKEELSSLIKQNELILNNSNSGLAYITKDFMVQWENISISTSSISFEAYRCGEYCFKSGHNRTSPCENCVLQRVMESRHMEQIQFVLDNKRKVEVFATPVLNEDGQIDGIVIRMDDITEREQMIEELRQAKILAEQSDKLKSAFLANMSHEIRTPLNSIVGFSDLLITDPNDEDRAEYASIIKNNNELLLKLINDILDLSKIEAGSIEFKYEEFDLSEYFDIVASSMRQRITNPNVRMVVVNPYSSCSVYLDKNRVAQIMINYVTNAIKYTPKGYIEIGYECMEDGVRFYVKDSGIGISDDKRDRVFHRFAKLDEFAQGTGLGLSICKATAEAMGGNVGFDTKYGEGSIFWVFLPCSPKISLPVKSVSSSGDVEITNSIMQISTSGTPERKTILIAEDIYSNYLLLSTILKNKYNLIRADNGRQAVEYVENNHVDLVLMDMNMPVMNGMKATIEIRSFNKHLPIVALTAHAFENDRLAAQEVGCNDFLVKPIDKVRLNEVLNKYCPV